jgi:hypothetical protein
MRSALGRSPLAGDRCGHLRLSVARKRAPTDPGAATRDVSSADSPKLIDQKTCTPTMRSALGRSPLAGDRCGHLRLSVARKRAPTDPGAATRDVSSADSPKLIDRKTCTPTMRSALGRSPLAGDRCGHLRLSVARKRAPTDPGAAIRDVSSADSPKLIDQKTCTPTMRSALGRSPLAGDRGGCLRLSVARKRAPTDPGAATRDVSSADSPKLIDQKTCTPTMRSALGRSPLAGDRGGHLRLSVARKRAPTDPGAATRDVSSADSPKLIDQKTCTPTMRSALGRSPLAGDRGGHLRLSVARKRAPTDPGAATRDVSSADSPKLIDQKTCTPTMRSALGRSPLAGDRGGCLRLSVARKRAPTDPGAATRDVSSADSPKLIDQKTCTPTMRSALGRSPLAGDRSGCLRLSVARKRAPTDPGAAIRDVSSADSPKLIDQKTCTPTMRSALGRSPLAGDRCGHLRLSVARKRAPTDPGAAIRDVSSADSPKLIDQKTCTPTMRSALGRSPLAGDRGGCLRLSVARKRAPTDPGAATRDVSSADSPVAHRSKDLHTNHALGPG